MNNQDNSAEPVYTEKQVGDILRRAAELQDRNSAEGTSLASLKQAASELGIDPTLIERAAAEISSATPIEESFLSGLFGGPWRSDTTLSIPAVSEESWPIIVEEIRRITGRVGTPKQVGSGFDFLSHQPSPIHVTLTPRGKSMQLRVRTWCGDMASGRYVVAIGSGLALGFGSALMLAHEIHGSVAAAVTTLAASTFVGAIVGRFSASKLAKQKHNETRGLTAHIARVAQMESTEVQQVSETPGVQAPQSYVGATKTAEVEQDEVMRVRGG